MLIVIFVLWQIQQETIGLPTADCVNITSTKQFDTIRFGEGRSREKFIHDCHGDN